MLIKMRRFIIIVFVVFLKSNLAVSAGTKCRTIRNFAGVCESYISCTRLDHLFDKENITDYENEYIKSLICNRRKKTVCCHKLDCYTPDGVIGQCVPISNYPDTESDPDFLRNSVCDGKSKKICYGISDRPRMEIGNCGQQITAFPPTNETKCCGWQTTTKVRIVGGSATEIDEYPWLAIIKYQDPAELCAGALISNRYVLTAAHCVHYSKLNQPVSVVLGEYNMATKIDCNDDYTDCADKPLDVPVEDIVAHPKFNPTDPNLRNDIALIRLKTPVPYTNFIRPICLPSYSNTQASKPAVNSKLTVAGWGASDQAHPKSNKKLDVKIPVVEMERCSKMYKQLKRKLWSNQLCVGGERMKDSCTGDSGGPLMYEENNQFFVVGIVSFGSKDCGRVKQLPGVYTRVMPYNTWIRRNIKP